MREEARAVKAPRRDASREQVLARELRVGDVLVGTDRPRVESVHEEPDGRLRVRCSGRLGPFTFFPDPGENLLVTARANAFALAS